MRYLGLDVGKKNIGIAVGEVLASELTTLRCKTESFYEDPGLTQAIKDIKALIEEEEVDAVVAGLPVNEEGGETQESKLIRSFGKALEERLNIDLHYVNETLTSFMAQDMLEEQGASKEEANKRVDQMAATLILQQYLEDNAVV
jgi:putative Holliday junction resolvase